MSGVNNDTDPLWKSIYSDVYNAPSLQTIPWYAILGNHDYRKNPEAQIDFTRHHRDDRWTMPDHDFRRVYTIPANDATSTNTLEIIFIDTPLIAPMEAPETTPNGKSAVSAETTEQHLEWIEQTLAASTATWLIVAGHYPIYSMAEHGDTSDLIDRLDPLLRKYRVNAYINGHDHVLQHLSWHGIEYFTCGHGTLTNSFPLGYFPLEEPEKAAEEGYDPPNPSIAYEGFRFGTIGPGFGGAIITKDTLKILYYDRNGVELYSTMLTNPREISSSSSSSSSSNISHTHKGHWVNIIGWFAIAALAVVILAFIGKRHQSITSLWLQVVVFFRGGGMDRSGTSSNNQGDRGVNLNTLPSSSSFSHTSYSPIIHTDVEESNR